MDIVGTHLESTALAAAQSACLALPSVWPRSVLKLAPLLSNQYMLFPMQCFPWATRPCQEGG